MRGGGVVRNGQSERPFARFFRKMLSSEYFMLVLLI